MRSSNLEQYFTNPPEKTDVFGWDRLLKVDGRSRGELLSIVYDRFDLPDFAEKRFENTAINVLDYGAGTWGAAGLIPAASIGAEKVTFVGGGVDIIERADREKLNFKDAGLYELPDLGSEKFEWIEINDVISHMGDRDRTIQLLEKIGNSMTENGVGVIVQTDLDELKMRNILENYRHILEKRPDLLKKFVFIVCQKEGDNFRMLEGELAEQVQKFRANLHDKEFIMGPITYRQ